MQVLYYKYFCYECGCRIAVTDNFCPQCGTQLNFQRQPRNRIAPTHTPKYFDISISGNLQNKSAQGYILTHIQALANHLNAEYDEIMDILNEFSSLRSSTGVTYRIIDMSSRMTNPANGNWMDCSKVVTEQYLEDLARGVAIDYLFIIGGCDIIPMPLIPIKAGNEKNIDSDLPYCWLYREGIEKYLEDLTLFTSDMRLWCGRLPLASDTTLKDLVTMLSNALEAGQKGLSNLNMHVQSDPNWKEVTTLIVSDFKEYMPACSERSDFFHGPIMLTPDQRPDTDTFDKHFPYNISSVFYYNLHGGNAPGVNKFSGNSRGIPIMYDALYPKHMASVSKLNVVMTEACYGGWFRMTSLRPESKQKHETVLLAAMHASTVCYVGSSRVAYGISDKGLNDGETPQCADVFACEFLHSLYAGYPAGIALWHARKAFCHRPLDYNELITVFEFNLFGDPGLVAVIGPDKSLPIHKSVLFCEDMLIQSRYKLEYDAEKNNGVLGYVRNLVDRNMQEINSIITQHLYDVYGIEPRKLNRVLSNRTGDGCCRYAYCYAVDNGEWVVGVDGQTRQVLYTVCSK